MTQFLNFNFWSHLHRTQRMSLFRRLILRVIRYFRSPQILDNSTWSVWIYTESLEAWTAFSYVNAGKIYIAHATCISHPNSAEPLRLLTHEENVAMRYSRTSIVDMTTWQIPSTTMRNSRILDMDEAAVESPKTMRSAHKTRTISHNMVTVAWDSFNIHRSLLILTHREYSYI